MERGRVVVVNDTGALISALPRRLPARHLTTPKVIEEVRDRESRRALEELLETGLLEVEEPGPGWLEKARGAARRAGVEKRLSPADLEVLALALSLGPGTLLATDDYSLQRAAAAAGLRIVPIRYPGIEEARGGARRGRRRRGARRGGRGAGSRGA